MRRWVLLFRVFGPSMAAPGTDSAMQWDRTYASFKLEEATGATLLKTDKWRSLVGQATLWVGGVSELVVSFQL